MTKTKVLSFLPALLCAVALSSASLGANAKDIVPGNGWDVYQCENGDLFACIFNGGSENAYQVNCSEYSNFESAADFYCKAGRGGLANPPVVDGPAYDPAEDEIIRDEDRDIDEAPPRR